MTFLGICYVNCTIFSTFVPDFEKIYALNDPLWRKVLNK